VSRGCRRCGREDCEYLIVKSLSACYRFCLAHFARCLRHLSSTLSYFLSFPHRCILRHAHHSVQPSGHSGELSRWGHRRSAHPTTHSTSCSYSYSTLLTCIPFTTHTPTLLLSPVFHSLRTLLLLLYSPAFHSPHTLLLYSTHLHSIHHTHSYSTLLTCIPFTRGTPDSFFDIQIFLSSCTVSPAYFPLHLPPSSAL
jgi:hypothetical protein